MSEFPNEIKLCLDQLQSTEVGSDEWLQLVSKLRELGQVAVPLLLQRVWDSNIAVSSGVCKALAEIGLEASDKLIDCLGTGDDSSRAGAARILSGLSFRHGVELTHALPALRQALTDPEPEVRRFAAIALSGMKEFSEPAIPELITALKDEEWGVREWAANALDVLASKEAIGPLTEALLDEVRPVRDAASQALESIRLRYGDVEGKDY